ncbi:hypothetical protein Caci_6274 [Catenulispora acidiphila DSM 44928]|uniref:Lipoprotein n=1 Tax=Catenulispora acidiphila (strain DSM 44928 / JCM 14897 / NBRC 102108 / NRRL B-24433 / ID139908) TaxID=479433 RepID=C7QK54_CATAD|nr:hypothetical protein [Catenulispora acidiphila]ACU75128.1 hypothetical protein Caci_6274 [Catenulispora acidiphila DSM 44928]
MARVRFVEIVAVTALVGGLAACSSSSTSTGKSATGAPSTSATGGAAAPSTTATATASSTASQGTATIAGLLAAFGTGDITVKHMPTADPAWVARVQTENQQQKVPQATDPKVLNLMALVDEAAREKDTASLARLCTKDCDAKQQAAIWAKPGVLDQLTSLIEKAPMGEGTVLPDFVLFKPDTAFHTADETAYGKLVGATSPAGFFANGRIWTSFQNGTGGPGAMEQHWTGIKAGDQ